MAYRAYIFTLLTFFRAAALAVRGWGMCLCLLLAVPLCAAAQNNPYKINDRLYAMYQKAYAQRTNKNGLRDAGAMYREAVRLGDGKAQCLALSVEMFYYYYQLDDEPGFRRAVKAMQDKALATGYRQYYYFGMANIVNWLLLRRRTGEAMQYVTQYVHEARKGNDMYGLFSSLNSLAQVHIMRMEYGVAVRTLNEALDIGRSYLPDQNLSAARSKLTDCYSNMFDYTNMYAAAAAGYRGARTKNTRLSFLADMTFAAMKLGHMGKARECCEEYVGISGPLSDNTTETRDLRILIMQDMLDGNYSDAQTRIDWYPKGHGRTLFRLKMLMCDMKGDLKQLAALKTQFYRSWLQLKDEVSSQDMAEISAQVFNQKLEMENSLLEIERRRMENQRQRAAIDHSRLQLSNAELSLRNSSLELGRARTDADMLRLATNQKRLENDRLKSRVEQEHTRRNIAALHVWTLAAVMAVLIVAAIHVLGIHRRITRRLRDIHGSLAVSHAELTKAHRQAVAADNVKTALIQNMTRDINIPLDSITGFAQLLADRKAAYTPAERAEYFRQIRTNTDRMLDIVRDVLDKAQK